MLEKSIKKKPIIQLEKEQFLQQSIKRREEQLLKKKLGNKFEEQAEVLVYDYRKSNSFKKPADKENIQNNSENTHGNFEVVEKIERFCAKCETVCNDNKFKSFKCGHCIHNVNILLLLTYLI